jgi:uncharacterized protein YqjF (DUF2071 family)
LNVHPALTQTDHRPWPLPPKPWVMRQRWCDLLFAHWPVPAPKVRALVPSRLAIQEHDGTSWVGVVPFRMEGVMLRPLPDLPGVSAFPELNLRLYVELDGKPGVWFISLDAASRLAVRTARRFFHLPYFDADMDARRENDGVVYSSVRAGDGPRVAFRGSYAPTSDVFTARPGSLEHFLTERYCLYAQAPDGGIVRADIHHHPWPLQVARAEIEENTIADVQGIALAGPPPLLHFARRIDVVNWLPLRA